MPQVSLLRPGLIRAKREPFYSDPMSSPKTCAKLPNPHEPNQIFSAETWRFSFLILLHLKHLKKPKKPRPSRGFTRLK